MLSKKEQLLLFRIRHQGDAEAFTEIYVKHQAALRRFLSTKLPAIQDVEDAHTAVFERTWNYLRSAEVEQLSGLIYTIARGVISDFYRTRKETSPLEAASAIQKDSDSGAGKRAMEAGMDVLLVRQAMEQLGEKERTLIVMKHFDGLRTDEIAQRVGMTSGSVSVALHRALEKLRAAIADKNV